ncbi:hypothetical protein NA78x_003221 [Anatilimnocola sp. NA78]|uniref:hypothetical protein n=1 Tax=Anatilimnocola sp. NA78 TaxID=3415683 RepID=UPI003CE48B3C
MRFHLRSLLILLLLGPIILAAAWTHYQQWQQVRFTRRVPFAESVPTGIPSTQWESFPESDPTSR